MTFKSCQQMTEVAPKQRIIKMESPISSDIDGTISVEARNGILLMGLNRPAKMNGLTPAMFTQMAEAYNRLEADDSLRVGVLHGHGPHFTAGLDLPKWASLMGKTDEFGDPDSIDPYNRRAPWRKKPVIAAVQGITFTAGLEMALGADIIVAAGDCRFAMMEPKRGLMPSGGATYRFVERGGWGNAMRWLLTGDEFDSAEAMRIGIVQEIIAARAPLAVQATKANAHTYALHGETACVAEITTAQGRLAASADFQEGVRSFIEKRAAVFHGK
jgi:enoyl-CoA hydratase